MKEKACGAIVYKKKNNKYIFLILKQISGNWSFPKGHMEKGETEKETAIRETKEETGIDIIIDSNFREVITYSPDNKNLKDVVFFLGKAINGKEKPQENEIQEIIWVNSNGVYQTLTFDDTKLIFKKALEYLEKAT